MSYRVMIPLCLFAIGTGFLSHRLNVHHMNTLTSTDMLLEKEESDHHSLHKNHTEELANVMMIDSKNDELIRLREENDRNAFLMWNSMIVSSPIFIKHFIKFCINAYRRDTTVVDLLICIIAQSITSDPFFPPYIAYSILKLLCLFFLNENEIN